MYFKKFLKSCRGQSVVEYFILLTLMAALTIVGVSRFYSTSQQATERFTRTAVDKIAPLLTSAPQQQPQPAPQSQPEEITIELPPVIGGP